MGQAEFRGDGRRLEYTNTGAAIAAGDVVIVGTVVGVAISDIPATTGTGVLAMGGVYRGALAAADTPSVGDVAYWNDTNNEFTTVSAGATEAGWFTFVDAAADVCEVLLNGAPATAD